MAYNKSAVAAVMMVVAVALIMQCHMAMAAEAPSPAPITGNAPGSSSQASVVAGLLVSAMAFVAGFAWL